MRPTYPPSAGDVSGPDVIQSGPFQTSFLRIVAFSRRVSFDPGDTEAARLQKGVAVLAAIAEAPAGVIWGAMYLAFGEARAAAVPFAFPVLTAANLALFMVGGWYRAFRIGQLLMTLLLPFFLMLALGGFVSSSAVIFWSMLTPLGALIYTSRREATLWFVAFVGIIALGGALDPIVESPNSIPTEWKVVLFVLNVLGPSALAFSILSYFVDQLETEQRKSEGLLINVLPAEIAAVLKSGAQSVPERFESVSVLFADIVGSTALAATLPPDGLVDLLNRFFTHFDTLTERYGVEKISTSGDNYMVAAGVPRPRRDHAQALAAMALDMQDYLKNGAHENGQVQFRIGINSGAAVAGVIGQKKFHYDLWGDAVNRASRMESYGEPGRVQVSDATYQLIKGDFHCVERGIVEIKGIGAMSTWWLEGRVEQQQREDAGA